MMCLDYGSNISENAEQMLFFSGFWEFLKLCPLNASPNFCVLYQPKKNELFSQEVYLKIPL